MSLAIVAAWLSRRSATPTSVARLAIALPEDVSPDPGRVLGAPAISPDGTTVALTFGSEAETYLVLRRLDSDTFRRVPGTEGARQAFWSPDSRHIGFFAGTTLKRVPLAGGEPVTLCEVGYSRGGAWNAAGTILVGTNYAAGVLRVSEKGGAPVPATRLDAALGENSHRFPVFLPDGNQFLYFARTKLDENRAVYLASLDESKPRKRLLVTDSYVALARDPSSGRDYLLYPKNDTLWAQSFDTTRGELSGDPVAISGDVGLFTRLYDRYAGLATDVGRTDEAHMVRSRRKGSRHARARGRLLGDPTVPGQHARRGRLSSGAQRLFRDLADRRGA